MGPEFPSLDLLLVTILHIKFLIKIYRKQIKKSYDLIHKSKTITQSINNWKFLVFERKAKRDRLPDVFKEEKIEDKL